MRLLLLSETGTLWQKAWSFLLPHLFQLVYWKLFSLSKFASSKKISPHLISSPVSSSLSQSAVSPRSLTPLCLYLPPEQAQCGWCLKSLWIPVSHPNSEVKTCYVNAGCHALWTHVKMNCQVQPSLHCKNLRTTNIVYMKWAYRYLWCVAV